MRLLGEEYTESEFQVANDTCQDCFLNDPEYVDMTTYGDLFRFGLDYLRRRDVGLEVNRDELSFREEQIISLVNAEIEAGKAKRMKKGQEQRDRETNRSRGFSDGE